MSGRKPRQVRWPACVNTFEIARSNAGKPAPADRKELLKTSAAAAKSLREGVATQLEWSILSGSVELARAVQKMGIVRGMTEHLDSADAALKAIRKRCTEQPTWKPTALYFQELDAMQAFMSLHARIVNELGRAEFTRALNIAQSNITNQGNTVQVERNTQRMAA
jgi:hypothetical protein